MIISKWRSSITVCRALEDLAEPFVWHFVFAQRSKCFFLEHILLVQGPMLNLGVVVQPVQDRVRTYGNHQRPPLLSPRIDSCPEKESLSILMPRLTYLKIYL